MADSHTREKIVREVHPEWFVRHKRQADRPCHMSYCDRPGVYQIKDRWYCGVHKNSQVNDAYWDIRAQRRRDVERLRDNLFQEAVRAETVVVLDYADPVAYDFDREWLATYLALRVAEVRVEVYTEIPSDRLEDTGSIFHLTERHYITGRLIDRYAAERPYAAADDDTAATS